MGRKLVRVGVGTVESDSSRASDGVDREHFRPTGAFLCISRAHGLDTASIFTKGDYCSITKSR